MADRPTVLGVATYPDTGSAVADLRAVSGIDRRTVDHVAAAVLVKGLDGKLHLDRHDTTAADLAWGGALVGGALAVVAAPLAIAPLSDVATQDATWAGVGGIVGYFWHNIPKGQLLRMSDLLESGQAALVVVALDHTATDDRSTAAQRHRGDRRRDRWRRHRAWPTKRRWRWSSGRPDHDAAWRVESADRRKRRCTNSVSVLPATMHTTFVANTSSAPRPPAALLSPTAHPMYAAAGIVVTEMATPTASLPAVS